MQGIIPGPCRVLPIKRGSVVFNAHFVLLEPLRPLILGCLRLESVAGGRLAILAIGRLLPYRGGQVRTRGVFILSLVT